MDPCKINEVLGRNIGYYCLTTCSEQEARDIYTKCQWPNLQKFQRLKCRRLLVDMLQRFSAWEKEERVKRRPPVPYTDVAGRPVSPPNLQLEIGP